MSQKASLIALAFVALMGSVMPVHGHHGAAAFDSSKPVTQTATVAELRFQNPHVFVYYDVKKDDGTMERWSGWLTAPNKLARAGWTKNTLKPGDKITVTGLPHRDGQPMIQIRKLVGPDESELPLSEE